MAEGDDKFTHEELVALLERSIALENAARDRVYSREDLVLAAKELGVGAEVMERAIDERRARLAAIRRAPKPFGTKIELSTENGRFELRVPPLPPTSASVGPAVFTGTWLSFIGFWTTGASHAGFFFAAFSAPFWLAGFGMAARVGLPLVRSTTLSLGAGGAGGGVLSTRPFGKKRPLSVEALRVGDEDRMKAVQPGSGMSAQTQSSRALVLEHGTETFYLLEGFSDAERQWVRAELETWLAQAR
jgi:hypothetical protein